MVFTFKSAATTALLVSAIGAGNVFAAKSPSKARILPGAYVVEFADEGADAHSFFSNLTKSSLSMEPRMTLNHNLFNGASFRLSAAHDTDESLNLIQSMSAVNKIWPVQLYAKPEHFVSAFDTAASAASVSRRSPEASGGYTDRYVPHVMGGVDKLHEQGYTGEGLFVGIVDTGVDYNHPVLGAGFGAGFKVVTGYDLVGDDYNGSNTPVPDSDPMDCDGHGTHVSGILGANSNNPYGFTGVVPNATLGMWKVFGCSGEAANDVLIAAFNMAFEAGVDLISSSIGGSSGWVEDPWDVATQRIVEAGVPCSISAGNDGANGLFDTSSASEAIGATSVGSIDNLQESAFLTDATYSLNAAAPKLFGYAVGAVNGDFGTITVPMYAITLDATTPADACEALPGSTPDLSKYVVLIRRGSCTFDTKITNAQAFGAKRFMFYNNVAGLPATAGNSDASVPVGMVSADQGAQWITELAAGDSISVAFTDLADASQSYVVQNNTLSGGYMSTFTSWGPTFETYIRPAISAPGGYILSTYPLDKGGYAVLSGTSMACPFSAGVIALIKEVRGKGVSPNQIRNLMASTATPVNFNDGTATAYNYLAPVIQQGGGLVNAYSAAHVTSLLSTSVLALNDTAHFLPVRTFSIKNTGSKTVSYNFQNTAAATAYTLESGSIYPSLFPPDLDTSSAKFTFVPPTLFVPAGRTGTVVVYVTRPAGLDQTRIPVYSGYIGIKGSNGDSLRLPYAGVDSNLHNATVTDYADGYPYLASSADADLAPITAADTAFTLPNPAVNDTAAYGLPTIVWVLAMGSREVRVDVVPRNLAGTTSVVGEKALGPMLGLPVYYQPRNSLSSISWDGQLGNGTYVPAGEYKLLYRALKIFGNPNYDGDYEKYSTPYFTIKYDT